MFPKNEDSDIWFHFFVTFVCVFCLFSFLNFRSAFRGQKWPELKCKKNNRKLHQIKNARRQTHVKIQFYKEDSVTRFFYWPKLDLCYSNWDICMDHTVYNIVQLCTSRRTDPLTESGKYSSILLWAESAKKPAWPARAAALVPAWSAWWRSEQHE